jgi:uncharacterized damage-inducible protein DinB
MTWLEIEPPTSDEYDPYYRGYIEQVEGKQLSLILRQQRSKMLELLDGLTEDQADYRYASDKWSIKEMLGHLIDTERVFVYRAMSIARDEKQSLPGFDQDDYVKTGNFDQRSVESLRTEYEAVRNASIAFFESLDEASWLKAGMANDVTVSVRAIGYIVPGHEAHHLTILRERYLSGN